MLLLKYLFCTLSFALFFNNSFALRSCAETSFCDKLRSNLPDEDTKYRLSEDSLQVNGYATINLLNNKKQNITLKISALTDDRFRLQFIENGNSRYELVDVLAEEPKTLDIKHQVSSADSIILGVDKNSNAKIQITKSPLNINLLMNDVLQTVIDGNRIYFENTKDSQAFSVSITFPEASVAYGLHEKADHINLRNTAPGSFDPYRLKNSEVPNYKLYDTLPTYGSIPVVYGHSKNTTSGIFLHNAAQQWVEINNENGVNAYFMVQGGSLDLFTLPGPTLKEVVRQYTNLTGHPHLPQIWALGYHQCRYNYVSQDDVKDVVANMDNANFPMDTIWLDIDYTDGKRYFTWDLNQFSDPEEMQKNISSTKRKLITIIDPHYKVDENYKVYTSARDQGLFVKNADGSDFQGNCWPGLSSWFDYLDPKARDFYASQFSYENFPHSTETLAGIWNDMNEPSVFDNEAAENSMPLDCVHVGGVKHRDVNNMFGFLQTKGTHQGLMQRDNSKKRPFILTRSSFAGSQRYTAVWTGDNKATWEYLAVSYSMCLNANLLGIAFCGADVAGFNSNPTDELYQRWYQAGIWLPFYRSHSGKDTNRREPYLYPTDIQKVVRDAMRLRYKHLPVWYTTFFEHVQSGDPIIRPLVYEWPENEALFEVDEQLLVGQYIMAKPVTKPGVKTVQVYFPGDEKTFWYRVDQCKFEVFNSTNEAVEVPVDMSSIPYFYKSSSIIPRKDIERPSTVEMADDGYTFYVNLDDDDRAYGTLYLDDMVSFEYQLSDDYVYLQMDYDGYYGLLRFTQLAGSASTSKYQVKINSIVVNTRDSSQTFTTNSSGQKLSELKVDLSKEFKIQL